MNEYRDDRRYTQSHEWVKAESDDCWAVGISDFAQSELGDVVYAELPEIGKVLNAGDVSATLESVKAASDIYMPIAGEIVAANQQLDDKPELINESPYEDGWIFKVKPSAPETVEELLNDQDYRKLCEQ